MNAAPVSPDMHDPGTSDCEQTLHRFYQAFQSLDASTMAQCYHPMASFSDPVFKDLRGDQIGAMWQMLTRGAMRAKGDWSLSYEIHSGNERKALVTWTAQYSFGPGRKVVNQVTSHLAFWDGLIVRQIDEFNFWRWARQALGITGWLFGWNKRYQKAVGQAATRRLGIAVTGVQTRHNGGL
jgi:ketosteroid isomerase-like protein